MALSVTDCNSFPIVDLPIPIVVDILIQLSVESIVFCKCTCKLLHEIVSDPQFAKIYFARPLRSDVYPMVRPIGISLLCRTLYLVHPRLSMFENSSDIVLKTKFKIPLHNFEKVLNLVEKNQGQGAGMKKKRSRLNLHPIDDYKFNMENSCNGFLCLSQKDALVVTNPVTGEFVDLPVPPLLADQKYYVRYTLGFSPITNIYKVLRLFDRSMEKWSVNCPLTSSVPWHSSFAQIQILGSRLWKNIGLGPYFKFLRCDTYFSGTLNWILENTRGSVDRPKFVANFDFVNERFGLFSLPPFASVGMLSYSISLGVLRDCLCVLNTPTYGNTNIEIWVMREYGVEGSWTKVCDVGLRGQQNNWSYGNYIPITRLNNGAILIFHYRDSRRCGLIYYEPEKQKLRYSAIKGIAGGYKTIGFTPNFNLLKNVLVGDEVQVLNVKSRCAKLRLCGDSGTPVLVQENSA